MKKTSGQIKIPRKLEENIIGWALRAYARYHFDLLLDSPIGDFYSGADNWRALRNYFDRVYGGVADNKKIYRKSLKRFDLESLPQTYQILREFPPKLELFLEVHLDKKVKTTAGEWFYEDNTLVLYPRDTQESPMDVQEYKNMERDLIETIQHELRHFVQNLLKVALEKRDKRSIQRNEEGHLPRKAPGTHGNLLQGPWFPDTQSSNSSKYENYDQYITSPVEFLPQISSAFESLLKQLTVKRNNQAIGTIKDFDKNKILITMKEVQSVIGVGPDNRYVPTARIFFVLLRKDKHRWKRAVKEFLRLVQEHNTQAKRLLGHEQRRY